MNPDEHSRQEIEITRADWQVNRDLFVSYQADPECWVLNLCRSGRSFRFNEAQYRMLCTFALSEQAVDAPLFEKGQRFAQKLALYGLIERRSTGISSSPSEPACWSNPVHLATWALTVYLVHQRRPYTTVPLATLLAKAAGCYICLKRQGQLRGCFGSIVPNLPRLADDILQNTLAAACLDPRFTPVRADELNALELSVDIVQAKERISWPGSWDPQQYGLQLCRNQEVLATLLPGLEGINSATQQYETALRKAGLSSEESITLELFTTLRFPSSASVPLRPYEAALAIPHWSL